MKSNTVKNANVVKSIDDMRLEVVAKQAELKEHLRSHKLGELVNPRVIKTTKQVIARLKTAIRSDEITETANINKEEK
jgi:ribosomal protein L29